MGGYWVVECRNELEKAASLPGASSIDKLDGLGGGEVVRVLDPNGKVVGFVYGQTLREEKQPKGDLERDDSGHASNTVSTKVRKGTSRRFDIGPSPVHKLGHYGYLMSADKLEKALEWYLSTFNLKITDAVYDPKTGKDEICFMHIDLGPQYTDHHSLFLGINPEAPEPHVHHSSYEVNDYDTQTLGHDYLRSKG